MPRTATVSRSTGETNITLTIDLDGTGKVDVSTGVGFFDHMLNAFGRHGLFDLTVRATGDYEVDDHHTVEDVGIVLGQAVREALGDKAGIGRFSDVCIAMDEALVQARGRELPPHHRGRVQGLWPGPALRLREGRARHGRAVHEGGACLADRRDNRSSVTVAQRIGRGAACVGYNAL